MPLKRIILAKPRGFCAGVDRAIDIVEQALKLYGAPVYVRREIVHNPHVVNRLRTQGAIFVDELNEVPSGATTVFSAHGVAPSVHNEARKRNLNVIDATCQEKKQDGSVSPRDPHQPQIANLSVALHTAQRHCGRPGHHQSISLPPQPRPFVE